MGYIESVGPARAAPRHAAQMGRSTAGMFRDFFSDREALDGHGSGPGWQPWLALGAFGVALGACSWALIAGLIGIVFF